METVCLLNVHLIDWINHYKKLRSFEKLFEFDKFCESYCSIAGNSQQNTCSSLCSECITLQQEEDSKEQNEKEKYDHVYCVYSVYCVANNMAFETMFGHQSYHQEKQIMWNSETQNCSFWLSFTLYLPCYSVIMLIHWNITNCYWNLDFNNFLPGFLQNNHLCLYHRLIYIYVNKFLFN